MPETENLTETIPVSKIQDMKEQGMTNNQIIDSLQNEGFSSTQIFDVLGQAQSVRQEAPRPPPQAPPRMEMPNVRPPPPSFDPSTDTEEMIEAIIDEKWNDLMGDINKVISWKDTTENRITRIEQQISDMKDQFEKLHKAVIGKVGEYDQHILDVGAEVKAMEKVFSKVLPVFTDNVAELSRVTDNLKKPKGRYSERK